MEKEKKCEQPYYEWFFGVPYKAYCGVCVRLLYTGGKITKEQRDALKVCPHCQTPIDWGNDKDLQ